MLSGQQLLLWFRAQLGVLYYVLSQLSRDPRKHSKDLRFFQSCIYNLFVEMLVEIGFLSVAGFLSGELHLPDQHD